MEELEDAKSYWAEHSWKMDALFALEGMKVWLQKKMDEVEEFKRTRKSHKLSNEELTIIDTHG
jgi:hypothetical protein